MPRHVGRSELIDTILPELRRELPPATRGKGDLLDAFSREVLRRVDDRYLYRHRLTTLATQLRDSFRWILGALPKRGAEVRVFTPTLAEHGYELEGHVIETLMPDQPFIVDTLKLFLEQTNVHVMNSLHVVLPVTLDETGQLVALDPAADNVAHTSYTRWYVDWRDVRSEADVAAEVALRLELSRRMVASFHRMIRVAKDIGNAYDYHARLLARTDDVRAQDCEEVRDFLEWLVEDHFVFMGISTYARGADGRIAVDPDRGVGAMTGMAEPSGATTAQAIQFFEAAETLKRPIVRVRKSAEESLVHRSGKVDEVLVRLFDEDGKPAGGVVLHGLFTFKGLGEPGSEIPILRRKLARILEKEGIIAGGYEHKGIINAFNSLPVEYLFEAKEDPIRELVWMIFTSDAKREIQSQVVLNDDAHSAYAFIAIPKEYYNDELRVEMEGLLRANLQASYVDHRVYLGKFGTASLHFYLTGQEGFGCRNLSAVESLLVEIATPWTYRLLQRLEIEMDESDAAETYHRWADAFPEAYSELTPVEMAVADIGHLEKTAKSGRVRFDLFPWERDAEDALLRIYSRDPMQLTSILPVVDNFGIVVVEQWSFDVRPAHTGTLTVNTLRVRRGKSDLLAQRESLIEALRAVFGRLMRSDRLNRLLLPAHLTWQDIDVFRAYFQHSRLLGHQLDPELVQKVLMSHASLVAIAVSLFRTRFDPDLPLEEAARETKVQALATEANTYLEGVRSFEEDRILRIFLDLIRATVRTNVFRTRADGEHFISFKIDCARVAEMPDPRPMFEIYVHHRDVEGVHLRGGRIARGGIRWSDRLDDYRSEVLGLMATQMAKNTLIVPVGAKGGFILKDPVDDPAEARARADEKYRIFIRGLLELTDNFVDGEVVPPPRVRRYDGDDPYLVVAADKGTAHLSDTANEVARSFDFWLGDAFASGGSAGYDHKVKGITARGGWVSVRRHFHEIGVDPERDPITVVGIGDMSGDVFGNGMLLSRSMKLVGAFNHKHIFLDPDPDPEASFAERKRLFEMPRSQWSDYDRALISPGGGVFERSAKRIELGDRVRERLGTHAEHVSGEELVRLVLTAEVDLLWNGGIGTYVKASTESHADVEDKANDRVRVDASELRCRVVGEGGNLGFTMKARVEFALQGGRLNLDAIDNSGGVDLSDHEVNIKILLQRPVRAGVLTVEERNALLARLGDQVCDKVLANNGSQSLAISLDVLRSQRDIWSYDQSMAFLRARLGFSRRVQKLPRGVEALQARLARGQGFLRPEVAKLLAYSKMVAYAPIMEEPIGTRPEIRPFLVDYFPAEIVETYPEALDAHMLYREIAATVQVNHIVDHAGVTFFPTLIEATDRTIREVAAGYLLSEELLSAPALRDDLLALGDSLPARGLYDAFLAIEDALAETTRWLLTFHTEPVHLGTRESIEPARTALAHLARRIRKALPPQALRELDEATLALTTAGLPADLAQRVAALRFMTHGLAVADLARRTDRKAETLAPLYYAVGYGTRVFLLTAALRKQVFTGRWDQIAMYSMERGLAESVMRLTTLIAESGRRLPSAEQVEEVLGEMPGIAELRRDIEALLRSQVPMSAVFVLSERLQRRIVSMSGTIATRSDVSRAESAATAEVEAAAPAGEARVTASA